MLMFSVYAPGYKKLLPDMTNIVNCIAGRIHYFASQQLQWRFLNNIHYRTNWSWPSHTWCILNMCQKSFTILFITMHHLLKFYPNAGEKHLHKKIKTNPPKSNWYTVACSHMAMSTTVTQKVWLWTLLLKEAWAWFHLQSEGDMTFPNLRSTIQGGGSLRGGSHPFDWSRQKLISKEIFAWGILEGCSSTRTWYTHKQEWKTKKKYSRSLFQKSYT